MHLIQSLKNEFCFDLSMFSKYPATSINSYFYKMTLVVLFLPVWWEAIHDLRMRSMSLKLVSRHNLVSSNNLSSETQTAELMLEHTHAFSRRTLNLERLRMTQWYYFNQNIVPLKYTEHKVCFWLQNNLIQNNFMEMFYLEVTMSWKIWTHVSVSCFVLFELTFSCPLIG